MMIPQAPAQLQAPLLSPAHSTDSTLPNVPRLSSFYALGDSYSAGIGANCSWVTDDFDPTGSCLKCKGAYPYQIVEIANSTSPSTSVSHQDSQTEANSESKRGGDNSSQQIQVFHLGCTGASINDILTIGWDNRTSQLQLLQDAISNGSLGTWATLSVGGNDVGFANIVTNCLMLNTFPSTCEASLNATESRIRDPELLARLVESYLKIVDVAGRGLKLSGVERGFTLIVVGYARFFNEDTEECDGKRFFVGGRYLSREFRGRLNGLIEELNRVIEIAVAIAQMSLVFGNSRSSVFLEQWDGVLEGRRFCEVGGGEREVDGVGDREGKGMGKGKKRDGKSWERDAWFFTVAGEDILDGGDTIAGGDVLRPPGEEPVDFERLAAECNREGYEQRRTDGAERLLCNWAKTLHYQKRNHDGVTSEAGDGGRFEESSRTGYPWYVKKAMHPKTVAHAELGRRIYKKWMNGEYS
ncbi:hypothetical protein ONS95_004586 [Cadophora gregata]|uniref:uncharacterized protein n=1 Tax=Cadophora gregata TaxID=51156 RepID=UPI0026DB2561|nr:uncharacterized protein ONS95_004586 [Cadophora gregata]KAK0105046.1 hypothetical protein ONS96_004451 [Cadophora gregata f. sp. sojae]KAK0106082.1 hypothetical protein ONS95_004586 [Cadophora gregata]